MKSLDNYQTWNEAFYHLGAKGSPENNLFEFSKEEFFVKGTIFALNDARTLSAFSHWVTLFGKDLNPEVVEENLKTLHFDPTWLGYYLDLINKESFKELYRFTKVISPVRVIHGVRNPDPILLKWGFHSKPLSEAAEKYLHFDSNKNRVF